jgi:hypothetical protein
MIEAKNSLCIKIRECSFNMTRDGREDSEGGGLKN